MTSDTALPVELLPCPFCGSGPTIQKTMFGHPVQKWVACAGCGASSAAYSSKVSAITAWNTRALSATRTAVKPLEWSSEPPYSVARVFEFKGFYSTERVDAGVCELRGTFCNGDYPTAQEAKAAAQADYERRILSALVEPVVAPGATTPTCKQPLQVAAEGE